MSEKREEVFVKATGRAIEKALNVAKWFEEKETEYTVRVNTGSVVVVDDIVEDEEMKAKEEQKRQRQEEQTPTDQGDAASKSESKSAAKKRKRQAAAAEDDAELPESRTRWIKMVEVAVSLK